MLLQDNICLYRQHNKFMHLPHFSSLRMESCSLVSKDPFVLIGHRCRFLEELDVTDNEIDNEGFTMGLSCPFNKLYYQQMIKASFFAGLKSISRCSKLLTLKLGICSNITDDGLTHVANGCSELKELDLYRFATFKLFSLYRFLSN